MGGAGAGDPVVEKAVGPRIRESAILEFIKAELRAARYGRVHSATKSPGRAVSMEFLFQLRGGPKNLLFVDRYGVDYGPANGKKKADRGLQTSKDRVPGQTGPMLNSRTLLKEAQD